MIGPSAPRGRGWPSALVQAPRTTSGRSARMTVRTALGRPGYNGPMRVWQLALLVTFVLSCSKTYSGSTEPVEDNEWYRCELVPDKRAQNATQVTASVKCTA